MAKASLWRDGYEQRVTNVDGRKAGSAGRPIAVLWSVLG
jgi:hypothetical protein